MQTNRTETGDSQAVPVVTLTRAHRDAIRAHIELELDSDSLSHHVERGEKDEARALVRRFDTCLRVLDQLGWIDQDDRDAYQLALDPETITLLDGIDGHARGALEDDRRAGHTGFMDQDLDAMSAVKLAREAVA